MIKKIQRSVLGNVFISIFAGLTFFMIVSSYWLYNDIKEDRFRDMAYTMSVIKRYYELSFRQWETTLISVGQRLLEFEGERVPEKRLVYANTVLKNYKSLLAFGLVDTTGQVITFTGYSPNDSLPNLMQSENSIRSFVKSKEASGVSIGEAYYFPNVNDWILPIRVPLRDSLGILQAVNTTAIQYRSLNAELKSFGFDTSYRVHMINKEFNTSQLYYPLQAQQYSTILRKDASIYSDIESIDSELSFDFFSASNSYDGKKVYAARTELQGLAHELVISIDQVAFKFQFWSGFQIIMLIYIVLCISTGLLFNYFKKKEGDYLDQLESERNYTTSIVGNSPSFIIGLNEEMEFLFVNPSVEKITGFSKNELLKSHGLQILCPGEHYLSVQKLENELIEGDVNSFELKLVHKKGNLITTSINVKNNINTGDFYKYIIFGQDISERREAQQKLRQREANLKSLFESTNSIIGLFDKDKRLVEFNDAFAGYARIADELELYPGIDILKEMKRKEMAELFNQYLSRALSGEKFRETLEYPAGTKTFFFLFNYNPIFENENIIGVSMFVEDITQLKEAQTELEKYTENLEREVRSRTEELESKNDMLGRSYEELERTIENLKETQKQLVQAEKMASLGVLAAGIGHEINNPLNFIKNGSLALNRELEQSNPDVKEKIEPLIEIINDGIDRASKIVKSLSHFSRQATEMTEECDIHQILENCLVILHNKIKHKAELVKDFCDENVIIKGSETKLHQAFLNIIANAEQAIDDNGKIIIKTRVQNNHIVVTIKDSGEGIPDDNLSKISDPFFTTKPPGVGTGLGLFITYNLVEEHGGNIKVNSKVNNGTEFKISLPLS